MAKTIRDLHKNNKNEKPFGKSTFFLYVFFILMGVPRPLCHSWKRRGNVGLYRLKAHGGPPVAQVGCPGTFFPLLSEHSCVFSCPRTLGGTIPLNDIGLSASMTTWDGVGPSFGAEPCKGGMYSPSPAPALLVPLRASQDLLQFLYSIVNERVIR